MAYPIKNGIIPIKALTKTGNEYSIVRKIREYFCEYIKYLGRVAQANKQPKPIKESSMEVSLIGLSKYKTVPINWNKLPRIAMKQNLLTSLDLSERLKSSQANFFYSYS